jgi:hypothetical protein
MQLTGKGEGTGKCCQEPLIADFSDGKHPHTIIGHNIKLLGSLASGCSYLNL